jgi:hypothetical protein
LPAAKIKDSLAAFAAMLFGVKLKVDGWEAIVPTYDVHALCIACGDLHPMGISVAVTGTPIKKQSVAEKFSGQKLPRNIQSLNDTRTYCPKFGRHYAQRDDKQIFLILRE